MPAGNRRFGVRRAEVVSGVAMLLINIWVSRDSTASNSAQRQAAEMLPASNIFAMDEDMKRKKQKKIMPCSVLEIIVSK